MKHVMLLLPPRNPDRKNWPGGGGRAAEEAEVKNKKEGTRAREGRDDGRGEGEDGLAVLVGVFPLEPSHPTGTTSSQPMHPVAA